MGKMMGSRHLCDSCGTEVIVMAEGSEEFAVACCGKPLRLTFSKGQGTVAEGGGET